jgi:arabinogalactan endo-1,4-beta-galactosidase
MTINFKMGKLILALILFLILLSCNKDTIRPTHSEERDFIYAADISAYPEIAETHPVFYYNNGMPGDFLSIIKAGGINTIRLRLWVNPSGYHSGFTEVKQFSEILKIKGFKIWLTVHYSDTWADPGHQAVPLAWQGMSLMALKDSLAAYTKNIVKEINPDFIQIGNEINSGLLHPYGNIETNYSSFIEIMNTAINTVRSNSTKAKIIIHYAGTEASVGFFEKTAGLDYDIIALSYYPVWHGKSVTHLKNTLSILSGTYQKQVIIAETAYPFTLDWNDHTNNIVGLNEQLILPDYPASKEGQRYFIRSIRDIILEVPRGMGFCYWGGELIAWKGMLANDGSPWENQALFDFENRALPVLEEFVKP